MAVRDDIETLEHCIVGCLLRNPELILSEPLDINLFGKLKHIVHAMIKLSGRGVVADIITITEEIDRTGTETGMMSMLGDIQLYSHGAAGNYSYFLKQLKAKVNDVTVFESLREGMKSIAGGNPSNEVLGKLVSQSLRLFTDSAERQYSFKTKEMMQIMVDKLEEIYSRESGDKSLGIMTGLSKLDDVLGGLHKSDMCIVGARPGQGKCLGKGTKILMFDGSLKNVEDILIGDQLMGPDSLPRNVLSLATGREMMYWIRQKKGNDYRVNESHILSLKRSKTEGKHKNGDVLNIPLVDYIGRGEGFKSRYKGYMVPVSFKEKPLSLDPYFLGVWLGDGTSSCSAITNVEPEITDWLCSYAKKLGLSFSVIKNKDRCQTLSISCGRGGKTGRLSIKGMLRDIGVINNKHIPVDYLINSTDNRLLLLAGLLDTDGYCSIGHSGYEIIQKDKKLIEDIKFLCNSLGFRAQLTTKRASIKSIGFEGDYYRLKISGDLERIPNRVERRKAPARTTAIDWRNTAISVEKDVVDDYYGFEIDGDKLFLLDDMTVTHNTSFGITVMINAAKKGLKVGFISTEMAVEQISFRVAAQVSGLDSKRFRKADFDDQEWARITSTLALTQNMDMRICDKPLMRISDVMMQCRAWDLDGGIDLVIVDYLTRIKPDTVTNNQNLDVGEIATQLKNLARDLKIPVIVLAQLNRNVANRADQKPRMSDLRDSGIIEQEADSILLLNRQEDNNGNVYCSIIIDKNRHGECVEAVVNFEETTGKWWCEEVYNYEN